MTTLILTKENIQADIEGFQARIRDARRKISELPATTSTYKERKKLEDQRCILRAEIAHVSKLIGYADAALDESL